jgi:hypothetical protein
LRLVHEQSVAVSSHARIASARSMSDSTSGLVEREPGALGNE